MVWHSSFQWICFGGPARHSNFQFFTIYRGVFYTQILLQRGVFCTVFFYTEMVLHTGAFRLGHFLGRGTLTRARLETQFRGGFKPFWNQFSIHSHSYVYTQKMFAEICFTEMMLQRGTFRRSCVYTEMLSHFFIYLRAAGCRPCCRPRAVPEAREIS